MSVNVPGGKKTARTTRKTCTQPTLWLEELPATVKKQLAEASITKAIDFAMSFASVAELAEEFPDLPEKELDAVVDFWTKLRREAMGELKQAKLPTRPKERVLAESSTPLTKSTGARIRTFAPVVGKDGHRHGLAPSKRARTVETPQTGMSQQTFDDILDVLHRVGER